MYQVVNQLPQEGCYIRVWVHEGKCYSDSWEWRNGISYFYDDLEDEWEAVLPEDRQLNPECALVRYIILGEQ